MKFEIKHRFNSPILFSIETDSWKLAMEAAVNSSANLRYADLSYANLRYADLSYANLSYADLSYADLRSADLRSANLRSANLRSADLRSANLRSANLRSANLRYADLSYANLRYADLRSADLRSANLSSAIGLERFPISIFGHKHALCTHPDGRLAVGCEVHSFEEWEEQVQQIGEDNDYSELDIEIYKLHIAHIAKTARLLWKDKYPVATKKVAAD